MNGLPYYKAYPRDFFEGTVGMPFDLKGAYRLLLDLIYMHGGELHDEPRFISGHLGCSVRAWNLHRAKLIEMGKISCDLGIISNFRADKELESLAKLQDNNRKNGSQPKKIKHLTEATAEPARVKPEPEPDKEKQQQPREAVQVSQTNRERLLTAMGADPVSGMIGSNGSRLGTMNDMLEAEKWTALGVSTEDQCRLIAERCAAIRSKQAHFTPRGFGYFTGVMADFAAKRAAPIPQGYSQAKPDDAASKLARYNRRAGANQ